MREGHFIENIVDYSKSYNTERRAILTHATNEMKTSLFSHLTVFDANVWSFIIISIMLMILILLLFHKTVLIEKKISFKLLFELLFKFYASCLQQGINIIVLMELMFF